MFCSDISAPLFLIFSNDAPHLLYYSHIPATILSFLIGFFVFLKSKTIEGRILLSISVTFSLWAFLSLIVWTNIDSQIIMFTWSFFPILFILIYVLSLYFFYVFTSKKDAPFSLKLFWAALLLPAIILTATKYNLTGFDLANCESEENIFFVSAYYVLGLIIALWILVLAFLRYRKAEKEFKRQIVLLTIGIELFLLSFFTTGFLASYLSDKGIISDFGLEFYGLLSMTVFMGFLAYLIVKYKAFNIKLLAAQALILSLVGIIASELFFAKDATNQILILVSLALSVGFGYVLYRSVKMEIQRKEELQEITNQLAVANDKLRVLDNAKSEFISIASHQLRTPLTAVKGFVSLILEGSYGKISTEVSEVLNKVYLSNERLIALVEDLLNLSRIESGRMEYNFEKVEMGGLCQEVYDTFTIRAKDKGLSLELGIPEKAKLEAATDRNKVREVISNLVDNALKYTVKGGVKISLSRAGDFVRIAISDTGIGIPQEEMGYLFQKFSRGKDTSRLNTGGTGLGLHVGKKMMDALHGRIWAESGGADSGSTFFVEVPVEIKDK